MVVDKLEQYISALESAQEVEYSEGWSPPEEFYNILKSNRIKLPEIYNDKIIDDAYYDRDVVGFALGLLKQIRSEITKNHELTIKKETVEVFNPTLLKKILDTWETGKVNTFESDTKIFKETGGVRVSSVLCGRLTPIYFFPEETISKIK